MMDLIILAILIIMFLYLLYMIAHTKDLCTHVSKLHVNLYSEEIRNGKKKIRLTNFIKISFTGRGICGMVGM